MNQVARYCAMLAAVTAMVAATSHGADQPAIDPAKTAEALNGSVVIKSQDGVQFVPVVPVEAHVPWRAGPVTIDGSLSEWDPSAPTAVLEGDKFVTWTGKYRGADDLSTKVWLARDAEFLYLAVRADDDKTPAPSDIELAIASANSPLITTWRDVGMRYGANDIHLVFKPAANDQAAVIWRHVPSDLDVESNDYPFSTTRERAQFFGQHGKRTAQPQITSKMTSHAQGDRQVTMLEAAIPWRLVLFYNPVSYGPLKLNLAIRDNDGATSGIMAWTPGIIGAYSAAHFPTLLFDRPTHPQGIEAWAAMARFHYVNQSIDFGFGFFNPNPTEISGVLTVRSTPSNSDEPLYNKPITLAPGYSRPRIEAHSESVHQDKCTLTGQLTLDDGTVLTIPIHAPSMDDSITIMPLAFIQAKIDQLQTNAQILQGLYDQIQAKGLDTAYPLAYLSLQKMFIARCKQDLANGDSHRVLDNTSHLVKSFESHKSYMEKILRDPSAQLKVPPRFVPEKLTIKNGYYFDGDRPVFLWGPCLFWYMQDDQHYAWELGFNSVGPDLPIHDEKSQEEIKKYMRAFEDHGMLVNASVANFQLEQLRKDHPDTVNVDGNMFLPFIIQHPLVRDEIEKRTRQTIDYYKQFPAVRTYWLWNEPWYFNYSERTRKDFIERYVKPTFKTLEAVNKRWGTDYKNFDDIQIQRDQGKNMVAWYDFQQFQNQLLSDFFTLLNDTARATDPTRPTHVKFMAVTLAHFDLERLSAMGAINGRDGGHGYGDMPFMDFGRSVFPDKPIVDTELHLPWKAPFVDRSVWLMALHGLADGNWWCWHSNPRFSNSIASAPNMEAVTVAGLDIQRLFDPYIYQLNQKKTVIATLFPKPLIGRGGFVSGLGFDWSPAQNSLGIQPHYITENQVAAGELDKYKLLLAGETGYPLDATYQGVLKWVNDGGTLVVIGGSFAINELGQRRDNSQLIKPDTGDAYTAHSKVYPVGAGRVILANDTIPKQAEGDPNPLSKRTVFREVIARAQRELGLTDDVALDIDPSQSKFQDFDWRSTKVGEGYALLLVPADYSYVDPAWWEKHVASTRLKTIRPIKKIVNLLTQQEIEPADFKLAHGVNMFFIELQK